MRISAAFRPLIFAAALAATDAGAFELEVDLSATDGKIEVKTDLSDYFTDERSKALDSGFTTTLLLYARLESNEETDSAPASSLGIRIRYDVWDETYKAVLIEGENRTRRRFAKLSEATDWLANLPPLLAIDLQQAPEGTPIRARAALVVNPMSREEIDKVRDWIENPLGSEAQYGWVGSMIGALIDERSGFASRRFEGNSGWVRRMGDRLIETD